MNDKDLLDASCRVALAALLHDLGKFAERAGRDFPKLDGNKATYCPSWNGRPSHIHAAYSGMAIDAIEENIPDIKRGEMTPFSSWGDRKRKDDSLINAAAMHHKPETPLQRIIATADRLASGFERATFDAYNQAEEEREENGKKVGYLRARQWPLLESIRLNQEKPICPKHRLTLLAMAPESIFPVVTKDLNNDEARQEYQELWTQFVAGLNDIPERHQDSLPLWLDHFDSLYLTFTHAIPSATATKKPGGGFMDIPSDVSLYDHSKTTAALAVALWQYHNDRSSVETSFSEQRWKNWDQHADEEILLIQGDFFGIQDFIFSSGGESTKKAAKLLRGRSFSVALLTELAAVKVLDAFQLPVTAQIINAAGKFLIVAPNLQDAEKRVEGVRQELDKWFLKHTFGQGGIGLAITKASRADFKKGAFQGLMKRLFNDLEQRKRRRFDLCGSNAPLPIFKIEYQEGACVVCGKVPAVIEKEDEKANMKICRLCGDQIDIGKQLVKGERLLVTRNEVNNDTLTLDCFGYRVTFTATEETSGKFGPLVKDGDLLRAWDFSLPSKDGKAPLWNGYARRAINGYVPKEEDDTIKDFGDLAKTSIVKDDKDQQRGVAALGILKGDVDNLGKVFMNGMKEPTFARMATLSRQVNAFFSVWLPWRCAKDFRETYTVFAGGDDFFLIGPWREQISLADEMHKEFLRYVGGNSDLHFSAGLAMTKPGIPVLSLADLAEDALDKAKAYGDGKEKNAITCWNRAVRWDTFGEMLAAEEELAGVVNSLKQEYNVEMSTGYLYGLLYLCDQAESAKKKPEDNIWRSRFTYRSWRFVMDKLHVTNEKCEEIYRQEFAEKIGKRISTNMGDYKIALFTHLYQRRRYKIK
ncbi:CRISPR-associated protein Csm1 [Gammaproteobacteria bacterium]